MGKRNGNSSVSAATRKIPWRAAGVALSLLAIAGAYAWSQHRAAERLVRADPARKFARLKQCAEYAQ